MATVDPVPGTSFNYFTTKPITATTASAGVGTAGTAGSVTIQTLPGGHCDCHLRCPKCGKIKQYPNYYPNYPQTWWYSQAQSGANQVGGTYTGGSNDSCSSSLAHQ